MNKRNKRLGTILPLLFISAIAATSGTLAWFSSVYTASITYGDATVHTRESSLFVTYKSSLNSLTAASEEDGITKITLSGENEVTDISGNGIDFYKPVWSSQDDVASAINHVPNTNLGDADGYFVDFTLTFSRSLGEAPLNLYVFLGENTTILPVDEGNPKDVGALKALRMAVITYDNGDSETGTPSVDILYAPEEETAPQYLEAGAGEVYGVDGYELVAADLKTHPFATRYNAADSRAVYPEIATLSVGTQTADVTFRFWIEGTDKDATNDIIGGQFKVNLDVYSVVV